MSNTGHAQIDDLETCPCSGTTLDKLIQPAILIVLAGGDLHGYKIAERLANMAPFQGQKPDVSGIYRSLRSMEERGLVVGAWDVSQRGPAKRLYKLTPSGRQCLARWVETLRRHYKAVGELLALAAEAVAASSQPDKGRPCGTVGTKES